MKQMTDERWNELLERQRILEEEGTGQGVERFKRKLDKAIKQGRGSMVGGARKLLVEALEPLEKAIQYKLDEREGQRGKRHMAHKWVKAVGVDVAAFLTVRSVLDNIHLPRVNGTQVALRISGYVIDELRYRRFNEKCPEFFQYKLKNFRTSSYAHMSRSMSAAVGVATYKDEKGNEVKLDVSDIDMPINQRMLVGFYLLNLLVESTGLVEMEQINKRNWIVKPAKGTTAWLEKRNDALAFMAPKKMPMVVPPLQWSPDIDGGYRFALRQENALVRGVRTKQWASEMRKRPMPVVYDALNRIQETPWKINTDVLELVRAINRRGATLGGIPSTQPIPDIPKPLDIAENRESKRAWRKKQAGRIQEEIERVQKALELSRILNIAENMVDEEAIWFPHNCDFRGRVYPVSDYLTPQGSDIQKALLTFAEGRTVGPSGIEWLAVHGANCLDTTPDGDKVSRWTRQERIRWIEEHTADILRVSDDPFTHTWWTDAEDPLQFFAFCCEWSRMKRSAVQEDYVSSLPVGMDGSCNGLQHFAALLLDEVGGQAVNVTPNDTPSDVYQMVADVVMQQCERDAVDIPVAHLWVTSGLIGRKLTKRPTMTFGYGSKVFGFQKQLLEYLMGLENWPAVRAHFTVVKKDEKTGEDGNRCIITDACGYMARCIWDALGETVVAAFGGMEWLRKSARVVSKSGKPIEWTVPETGFRVRQEYYETEQQQIKTMLCGQVVKPAYHAITDTVAEYKQASAIAPNVIHSLDAAALMMTVQHAANEGVFAFGMIHDSYSTVPGDAATLAACTRASFVKLYTERDVASHLWLQFQSSAPEGEEVPLPPSKGNLDISGVLASDYFFC